MDLGFTLKKIVSLFLDPVGGPLFLVGIGLFLIVSPRIISRWRTKKARGLLRRTGAILCICGWGILYLASIDPVAAGLTAYLERRCPPPLPPGALPEGLEEPLYIVVLAGGQRDAPGKPVLSSLTRHGFARVAGGVDLWRRFPGSTIVFTGRPDEVRTMSRVAEQLGVPSDQIQIENQSRDTEDHPRLLLPILGEAPFLLVTSATHFPRALALFQARGFEPIPAPVDFSGWPGGELGDNGYRPTLMPGASNVFQTSTALHEIYGLAWARISGQID